MLDRRATYLALVHEQYGVDMQTEEDVVAGRLRDYDALYVVEPKISARATAAIEQRVGDGGYVFGSCGAGSRDEFNEPGSGLARVFGIGPAIRGEVHRGEYRVRGSLNGMEYFDQVTLDRTPLLGEPAAFGVLGMKVTFAPTSGRVIGRFKTGAPAAVMQNFGRGKAVYLGACPGLSYLKDAGFGPAELKERYPLVQWRVLAGLAAARGVARFVEPSHPVVEAGLYDAPAGTALRVRSVEHGPLPFTEDRAAPALRGRATTRWPCLRPGWGSRTLSCSNVRPRATVTSSLDQWHPIEYAQAHAPAQARNPALCAL
jgi:hypothetical protein